MYNILETRIDFKNNQAQRVIVLVEMSKNDVRSICATMKPMNGYMHLPPKAILNDELLQKVAAYGREIYDTDEIFPGWKSKYQNPELVNNH